MVDLFNCLVIVVFTLIDQLIVQLLGDSVVLSVNC